MGWYSEQDQSKRDEINAKRRKDYADDKERFSLALAAHYGVDPALYRRLPNDTLKAAYGRLQVLISKASSPVPSPVPNSGPSPGPNPAPSPAPSPSPSLAQRPDPSPDPNLAQSPDPSPVPSPAPKNVTNSRIPKSNSMMDDECGLKSGAVDDSIQPDEISSLPSDLVDATISFAAASQSEEKRGWHCHLDPDGSPVVVSNSVAARRRIISSSSSNTTRVFDNKHPKNYNQNEVSNWLRSIGLGHKAVLFEEHAVDGSMLETLTEEDLRVELGLSKLQSRKFKLSLEKACGIVHFCDDESDESVAKRRKISDNRIEDNNEEIKENVETYYFEFHDEYCSYGEKLDRKGEEEEIII